MDKDEIINKILEENAKLKEDHQRESFNLQILV